jgi:hypothetical protein
MDGSGCLWRFGHYPLPEERRIMSDEEVMGAILEVLYQRRYDSLVHLTRAFDALDLPQNVLRHNLNRLLQKGLITWDDREVRGLGMGSITDYGIEVVTKKAQPPIPMAFQHITINNSPGAVVGNNNTQTSVEVGNLIATLDDPTATDGQKTEAKGRLQRIAESPLTGTIAAAVVGALAKAAVGGG